MFPRFRMEAPSASLGYPPFIVYHSFRSYVEGSITPGPLLRHPPSVSERLAHLASKDTCRGCPRSPRPRVFSPRLTILRRHHTPPAAPPRASGSSILRCHREPLRALLLSPPLLPPVPQWPRHLARCGVSASVRPGRKVSGVSPTLPFCAKLLLLPFPPAAPTLSDVPSNVSAAIASESDG